METNLYNRGPVDVSFIHKVDLTADKTKKLVLHGNTVKYLSADEINKLKDEKVPLVDSFDAIYAVLARELKPDLLAQGDQEVIGKNLTRLQELVTEREGVERRIGGQLLLDLVQNTEANPNNISGAEIKELGAYLGKWSLSGRDEVLISGLFERVPLETRKDILRAIPENAAPHVTRPARVILEEWIRETPEGRA